MAALTLLDLGVAGGCLTRHLGSLALLRWVASLGWLLVLEKETNKGESLPAPPHVHSPCVCCSASVSLAKSSLKAKPEVRGQGSTFYLCGKSCRSLDRGWGHREG